MIRPSLFSVLLAAAACLLSSTAWARYVPPPAPGPNHHCVTEVGWLSPADIRKIDEASEIARLQTGFVIDALLAKEAEPIAEVSNETFQTWKVGDPALDNGILIVVQPMFPRGQRKVHIQIGKGVEGKLPATKVNEILRDLVGPLLNDSDDVRTAVASAVLAIAEALGANESLGLPADASAVVDAGPKVAPAKSAADRGGEGLGGMLWFVLGGAVVVVAGYFGAQRLRRSS